MRKVLNLSDDAELDTFLTFYEDNPNIQDTAGFHNLSVGSLVVNIFQQNMEFIDVIAGEHPYSLLASADIAIDQSGTKDPSFLNTNTPIEQSIKEPLRIDLKNSSLNSSIFVKANSITNEKQMNIAPGMTSIPEITPISEGDSFISKAQQLLVKEQSRKISCNLIMKIKVKLDDRQLLSKAKRLLQKWAYYTSFKNETQLRNLRFLVKKHRTTIKHVFFEQLKLNRLESKRKFSEAFNRQYLEAENKPLSYIRHSNAILQQIESSSATLDQMNEYENYFFYKILTEFAQYTKMQGYNIYMDEPESTQVASIQYAAHSKTTINVLIILESGLLQTATIEHIISSIFKINPKNHKIEKNYLISLDRDIQINLHIQLINDLESFYKNSKLIFDFIIPICVETSWSSKQSNHMNNLIDLYTKKYISKNKLEGSDQNTDEKQILATFFNLRQWLRLQLCNVIIVELNSNGLRLRSNASATSVENYAFQSISMEIFSSVFNKFTIKALQSKQNMLLEFLLKFYDNFSLSRNVSILGYDIKSFNKNLVATTLRFFENLFDLKKGYKFPILFGSFDHWSLFRILFLKNFLPLLESKVSEFEQLIHEKGRIYFDEGLGDKNAFLSFTPISSKITQKVDSLIADKIMSHQNLFRGSFTEYQSFTSPLQAYEQNLKLFLTSLSLRTGTDLSSDDAVYIFPKIEDFLASISLESLIRDTETQMCQVVEQYRNISFRASAVTGVRPEAHDRAEVIALTKRTRRETTMNKEEETLGAISRLQNHDKGKRVNNSVIWTNKPALRSVK